DCGTPFRNGGVKGEVLGGSYSMTMTMSPVPTDWPGETFTSATVPDLSAAMLFSIFIASRTHTGCPASTVSPTDTSTLTIVPCIGTATLPLPATAADAAAADRRGRAAAAPPPAPPGPAATATGPTS